MPRDGPFSLDVWVETSPPLGLPEKALPPGVGRDSGGEPSPGSEDSAYSNEHKQAAAIL